jgi:hypothetical protein
VFLWLCVVNRFEAKLRELAGVEVRSWREANASVAAITKGLSGTVAFSSDFDSAITLSGFLIIVTGDVILNERATCFG